MMDIIRESHYYKLTVLNFMKDNIWKLKEHFFTLIIKYIEYIAFMGHTVA
jgi:hypothetical protein